MSALANPRPAVEPEPVSLLAPLLALLPAPIPFGHAQCDSCAAVYDQRLRGFGRHVIAEQDYCPGCGVCPGEGSES